MQKKEVNQQVFFCVSSFLCESIGAQVAEHAPGLTDLICLWEKNPAAKVSNAYQKKVLHLLNQLKLIAKEVKGSTGYKLCCRNEICALLKRFRTPALFLTLNPSDFHHPLVGILGGLLPEAWQAMSLYERSVFVANNPAATAQFFHVMMTCFLQIIVQHGSDSPGLFGHSETYYG
ncbi:hypothetical protein SERLA73DRAFT_45007 [Serpula lacrymans var. lacrymans S7.3]|uniref:Helitron helicase-like domain-containing protein n=1 Tax=Serpula lacrymans var. lacrymans (strain S7.3) TaxID=936435 RepID=F8PHG9_SERL3|nr:hypothetical protein SERLA73DRAFT_45007 [Serpula lacrymans var. lacrymans S7.3]